MKKLFTKLKKKIWYEGEEYFHDDDNNVDPIEIPPSWLYTFVHRWCIPDIKNHGRYWITVIQFGIFFTSLGMLIITILMFAHLEK